MLRWQFLPRLWLLPAGCDSPPVEVTRLKLVAMSVAVEVTRPKHMLVEVTRLKLAYLRGPG